MNTNPTKEIKPKPAKKRSPRDLCIGGCGRSVLSKLGAECRKCRRQRIHAGLKNVRKLERGSKKVSA